MKIDSLIKQNYNISKQIPLSRYTFAKTGGEAEYLVLPKNLERLQMLAAAADEDGLDITVTGNASNLITSNERIAGLVIILTDVNEIKLGGDIVEARAGATTIETAFFATNHGLSGLKFAAGIPGSVDGAVFMSAGVYGGESEQAISEVTVLTRTGEIKHYSHGEMQFGYRHSLVQNTGDIVVNTRFKLRAGDKLKILDEMNYLNTLRAYKQPLGYPSYGNVFKHPTGHFVGPMLIKAGLQGKQIGGTQLSTKRAGFIVNKGGAIATDYLSLIHYTREIIKEQRGIDLHTEVRIIGRDIEGENE